jgi:predicted nucleic acid-binding protein
VIQLDTSFLIDLHDELREERPGAAFEFLETLDANELLAVSVHVVAELRVGAELAPRPLREHEALDELLSGLLILYPDSRFAPLYGRVWATTNRGGRSVASMDLLIATLALLEDAPLVTRNLRDFSKVPGLRVLSY